MPSKAERRRKWNEAGENVVVLHQFPRGRTCPSPSPYPLKLETFLRMVDIKYIVDHDEPMSSKSKSPWITINGEDVADSQLAMEYLIEKLGKNPSAHLNAEQKAIARSVRAVLEDHFYFCSVQERWVNSFDPKYLIENVLGSIPGPKFLSTFFVKQASKGMKKQTVAQGIGRHSRDQVINMGLEDLKTVSAILGDKPFVTGDQPTEVDCVLFGFMCGLLFCTKEDHPWLKALNADESLKNLKDHTERMKEKYWQDWDDCLHKEKESKEDKKKDKKDEKKEGEEEEEGKKD